MLMAATAATGLFLIFTVFTAPLFSMVSFTSGGFTQQAVDSDSYYYFYLLRQASAQEQSTPPAPPSPTLPFTPFSLQQQEAVPEEGTGNATGTTTTPATNDTGGITELTASSASEPPLIAEIITNATQAVAPVTIRFDANITGGAPPYSYSWSVPDFGVIDQDRSITQMFFEPGTFDYILTATDARGKIVNDAVQIVISERQLPPTEGIVAPEPGGIAPPEEPVQEPGVPPPTVPGGEGGGDTGRGPQGGVTVGPTIPPTVPGEEIPPTVGEGGDTGRGPQGGITVVQGGSVRIIPYPTRGYVGDHFEIRSYLRDDVTVPNPSFIEHCYNYYPESGQCYPTNKIKAVDKLCTRGWGELAPPGYHWLPSDCIVVTYLSPGTYFVAAGIADYQTGKVTFDNIAQIDVREQPQGEATVSPEPGGVGLPEKERPPLPTAPEPEGVAPPDEEGGGGPPTAPEPEGVAPPEEPPLQPEGQLS